MPKRKSVAELAAEQDDPRQDDPPARDPQAEEHMRNRRPA